MLSIKSSNQRKTIKNCFITISATSRITFSLMSGIKLHCRHPRVMHESAKRVLWMTYHSYGFILSEAKLFFVCAAGTQLDPPHYGYEGPVVCCCPQRFVEWTLKRVWIGVWNRLCQQSASEEETQIQYLFIYKRSRLLKDSETDTLWACVKTHWRFRVTERPPQLTFQSVPPGVTASKRRGRMNESPQNRTWSLLPLPVQRAQLLVEKSGNNGAQFFPFRRENRKQLLPVSLRKSPRVDVKEMWRAARVLFGL